jgi:hypothetical protein
MNTDRDYCMGVSGILPKEICQEKLCDIFAYNCGGHWIAVIIVPKWQKVMYLDSNRGRKSDFSPLKSVTDE